MVANSLHSRFSYPWRTKKWVFPRTLHTGVWQIEGEQCHWAKHHRRLQWHRHISKWRQPPPRMTSIYTVPWLCHSGQYKDAFTVTSIFQRWPYIDAVGHMCSHSHCVEGDGLLYTLARGCSRASAFQIKTVKFRLSAIEIMSPQKARKKTRTGLCENADISLTQR